MDFLKKYKSFISDMFLNMVGFGIYIVAQQILFLPILAKIVNDEVYSNIVLYISILNFVCNVTGGELGNVRLIRNSEYKNKNIIGDFCRILLVISPIIAMITFPILTIFLKYSILGSFVLVITILMSNVRLYSINYYRLEKKFNKVIYHNIYYLIGIIISLIVFYFFKNIYILLFIPEFISMLYGLRNSDLLKMKLAKTVEMMETVKKFLKLGVVSLLTNSMNYFDKFLIYPMFGATSVAVYYAVNSMSKIASLITSPMSSVILSWVSNSKSKESKNKIIRMTLLVNIPAIIIVTIITIPLTYLALKLLYNQYFNEALKLILPIALTTAFSTVATLTKSVLLKFSNTNKLVGTYIIYFFSFAVLSFTLSKMYGLVGFAVANLITRIILWGSFIILLLISRKEKTEEENEFNK